MQNNGSFKRQHIATDYYRFVRIYTFYQLNNAIQGQDQQSSNTKTHTQDQLQYKTHDLAWEHIFIFEGLFLPFLFST